MRFKIEQIAITPPNPEAAIELLTKIGAYDWAHDVVVAKGSVHDNENLTNVADLAFNYSLREGEKKPLEFEVLHYRAGANWMDGLEHSVSHLGMHCSEAELDEWKIFFRREGIKIAQEVKTESHTNPVIAGKRLYHYCIFDTRPILGVDLKFIVRRDVQ